MSIQAYIRDQPHRAIALATGSYVLTFRHAVSGSHGGDNGGGRPQCIVEFVDSATFNLDDFKSLSLLPVLGTLGLITVSGDVFLCLVSAASKVATVRPGEDVQRIVTVEFHCLTSTDYDHILNDEINPYSTDSVSEDGFDYSFGSGRRDQGLEHPCLALKKLLSSGTFYYSADFDLTSRLQERRSSSHRSSNSSVVAVDSLNAGFLWNSYMIQPLVNFRSRLSLRRREALDSTRILTSAMRGFVHTLNIPAISSPCRESPTGLPSMLTLISRLSCRRAGTRFNARGIDDDGNVANFVQTETVFWTPSGICFSYVQVRGSVPLFWEQATGLLPTQQKISITRSNEATQPAFDKHFEDIILTYGAVHVINLLSNTKPGEADLTSNFQYHMAHSSVTGREKGREAEHDLSKMTNYDFHAETKGPAGYEAASLIGNYVHDSAESFAYFLADDLNKERNGHIGRQSSNAHPSPPILQQEGVFRTNCLDCLDRTNLLQTILSQMAFTSFLEHRRERATPDFWMRHSSLWADNGDVLSRIYAGTGALKSSFTRHGKMSLAGAIADARKSATRMYINNFADKGRQNTIDMLLGRLKDQAPIHLYDPINDFVMGELKKRSADYTSSEPIHIWAGTFNLNGRTRGLDEDLSPWLCPPVELSEQQPEMVAVGFQEIVELSPQQIMATDPARRQAWEEAVKRTLNHAAQNLKSEEYVLLRGGQLVGASLSVFVKSNVLKHVKNVEGSLKKTGMSGMAGNKGAVAIRMDYGNTSICFVTAHLAAGFANYDERNRDYKTISHGLKFKRDVSIDDHDTVIWLGDFNYRIGLSDERVRKLVQIGDLETLYANDQLNIQMVAGLTFPHYSESPITFLPTYRFDVGSDDYDTSEKHRIPAWTDRILRKGNNLRQIIYNSALLRFSDHRPVYATFLCVVSFVDEKVRETLASEIYQTRLETLERYSASNYRDGSEAEDLVVYKSVEPGLPPASSSRRKWWLDNGLPARSTVSPPGNHIVLNPNRPSNPFKPTTQPDWIKSSASSEIQPPRRSAGAQRNVPPPYSPSTAPSPLRSTASIISHLSDRSLNGSLSNFRSHSTSSSHSLPDLSKQAGKAPPPIPRKPRQLSSTPSSPSELQQSLPRPQSVMSQSNPPFRLYPKTPPSPPPPRRLASSITHLTQAGPASDGTPILMHSSKSVGSAALVRPVAKVVTSSGQPGNGISDSGSAVGPKYRRVPDGSSQRRGEPPPPPLPSRRGTGLIDEQDEVSTDGLRKWEVMRPTRVEHRSEGDIG